MARSPSAKKRVQPLVPGRAARAALPLKAADAAAVQALQRGDATSDQQQRALAWIIEDAAGTYESSFQPNPYDTAFNEGRRFTGLQIVLALKVKVEALRVMETGAPSERP